MIPTTLTVDAADWVVEESDAVSEGDYGETRVHELRVLIREGVHPQVKEMTFWHEVIHVLFRTRDFRVEANDPEAVEEQVASFLGPALFAFLSQNAEIHWPSG